jgi:hypothetical protein
MFSSWKHFFPNLKNLVSKLEKSLRNRGACSHHGPCPLSGNRPTIDEATLISILNSTQDF